MEISSYVQSSGDELIHAAKSVAIIVLRDVPVQLMTLKGSLAGT